jgi:hypothetical protein
MLTETILCEAPMLVEPLERVRHTDGTHSTVRNGHADPRKHLRLQLGEVSSLEQPHDRNGLRNADRAGRAALSNEAAR